MPRVLIALALAAAFAIGAAPTAAAAWFAAPDGDGPHPCSVSDPCEIHDALDNAPPGAKVAALAGTYALASTGLQVGHGISLQGPWGGPAAVIAGDGSAGPAVAATGAGTRVRDLSIEGSGQGSGIEVGAGAIGDRLSSVTSGSGAACTPLVGGLLRDSLCNAAGSGSGLLVDEGAALSGLVEITNVTAASAGDDLTSSPLLVRASGGAELSVEAANVIATAFGAAPEVTAVASADGSSADVDLVGSNYESVATVGAGAGVTPVGANGNQGSEPTFTDPEAGDLSEAAGSPTIDAGTAAAPSLGLLDLARVARISGSEPDIGAFEHVAPPDTRPPNVSIVSAPRGRLKTRRRFVDVSFELASDEQDVSFDCRLDRLPAESCSSPVSYRLKAVRGGVTYKFTARAVDAAGNRSGRAIRLVRVIRKPKR